MRRSSIGFIAAAAVAVMASAFAVPQARAQDIPPFVPTKATEDAVETSTDQVLLPTGLPGSITFRDCAEPCALRSLGVSAQTSFFVGPTQVTLADFTAFLRISGSKPLTVFRQPKGTDATRIVVIGQIQQLKQTQ